MCHPRQSRTPCPSWAGGRLGPSWSSPPMRFGGTSLNYCHWEEGIGPRELRAPFKNEPWGEIEENDVGIDEFVEFTRLVGCEPLICINAETGTPEEAANCVHYYNRDIHKGYVCPHYYERSIVEVEADLGKLRKTLNELGLIGRMMIGVTEWNATGGSWGPNRAYLSNLGNALYCARIFNLFQRNGDLGSGQSLESGQ